MQKLNLLHLFTDLFRNEILLTLQNKGKFSSTGIFLFEQILQIFWRVRKIPSETDMYINAEELTFVFNVKI